MTSCLHYDKKTLHIEGVNLEDIAKRYGTPCYIYSANAIKQNWQQFNHAFSSVPHSICYAVKANSNIAILHLLAQLGSGFDIVSIGELERVLKAGGSPANVVYSGVGKRADEIQQAIQQQIYCIDIESLPELERIEAIANRLQQPIQVALRVNPNINANTHSHITTGLTDNKFGISLEDIIPTCQQIRQSTYLTLTGLACHIGSQITSITPFKKAIDQLMTLHDMLCDSDIMIQTLNIGGGLGITYHDEAPPSLTDYADCILEAIGTKPLHVIIEPGRAIVGNAGALLTRVDYIKTTPQKNFAITDAGMNDLMRPALYDAWQNILPVKQTNLPVMQYDIAGPVCESADFLGKHRELAIEPGSLLAVDATGAYGFSMSSNYNSRPRPAEVLVIGDDAHLIRRRENITDLFSNETIPSLEHM